MSRSLALLLIAACDGGESPTETATIGALRKPCVGEGPQLCLQMAKDEQPPSSQFFGVEGYTHRWGTESKITFYREPVDPPLADGPSERLILLETVEESEPVTAPFQLEFFAGHDWFTADGADLTLYGTTIRCDAAICDQLTAAGDARFEVTMELTDDPQTLRATAVSL